MDMAVFFAHIRKTVFGGSMTRAQVAGVERIKSAFDKYGPPDKLDTQLAAILSTATWETGRRMQPVRETYASSDRQAIAQLERAFAKGQLTWVKTPYWRTGHFGRGDVQLTHKPNYCGPLRDAVMRVFGADICKNPEKALDPEISAFILVEGMTRGLTAKSDFTRYALEDFCNLDGTDYVNVRKCVNPGERSSYEKIARISEHYDNAIRAARKAAGELFRGPAEDIYNGKPFQQVRDVQEELRRIGYFEVGTPDGRWGSRTAGAVLAFRNDNGMDTKARIDAGLLAALANSDKRQIAPERAEATVADLREKGSQTIKSADVVQKVTAGGVVVGGVSKAVEPFLEKGEEYSGLLGRTLDLVEPVMGFFSDNILLVMLAMGGVVAWQAYKIKKNRVEDHQAGRNLSR